MNRVILEIEAHIGESGRMLIPFISKSFVRGILCHLWNELRGLEINYIGELLDENS